MIGIHALFGAFMAGAIMPENTKFRNIFIEKIEDVALVLLLPLFFVFTGLRTQIGLLNDLGMWKVTGFIIMVAMAGKFIGSALTAKFLRISWKDSLTIGALMNTRGLMELIVLNIGYELGVLGPEIFAMMVIMALVTTFMTGPTLDLINFFFKKKASSMDDNEDFSSSSYKILLSFMKPDAGISLLKFADNLTHKIDQYKSVTAMNFAPLDEIHSFALDDYEKQQFKEVIHTSQQLKMNLITMFKVSNDIDADIINMTKKGEYDLLLIMLGNSIYEGTFLGRLLGFTTNIINPGKLLNTVKGRTNIFELSPFDDLTLSILDKTNIPVGVMMDKNFQNADRVFIPMFDLGDFYLLEYAKRLITNNSSQIIVLDANGQIRKNAEIRELIRNIEHMAPNHISLRQEKLIEKDFLNGQDLMIVSSVSWKKLIESKSLWLADVPSTLIISHPK